MSMQIKKEGSQILISIRSQRFDGENHVLSEIKSLGYFTRDIEVVSIDLSYVEYMNSLGITEIISLHRALKEHTLNKARVRLLNVDRRIMAILELVEVGKLVEIVPA